MAAIIDGIERIIKKVHINLQCSICLDILEEPYSTHCNHQFCRKCIDQLFDRKKGKDGIICPLCKTKISKRGLSQNIKLVNVVAAVRNVLTSINDDIGGGLQSPEKLLTFVRAKTSRMANLAHKTIEKGHGLGSPVTKETKSVTNQNEVSEETPFQILRTATIVEQNNIPQSLVTNLEDNFREDENPKNQHQSNTRKSRKLRWSDETNAEKSDAENAELLRTLETADLGRKTRKSKRATRNLRNKAAQIGTSNDRQTECSVKSVSDQMQDKTSLISPSITHADFGTQIVAGSERQSSVDTSRQLKDTGKETSMEYVPAKEPAKYIVAETPMLLRDDTEEQLSEGIKVRSSKVLGKKKTSPFSDVNPRLPLQPRSPNVFDFVDEDPFDKSDLCERVKQRRKKEVAKSNQNVKKKGMDAEASENMKGQENSKTSDKAGDGYSLDLEQYTTKPSKSSKSLKRKNDDNTKQQTRPGRRRGKGQRLLEEAWKKDRESQLIDSGSTVNLIESASVSCDDDNVTVDAHENVAEKASYLAGNVGGSDNKEGIEADLLETAGKEVSDASETADFPCPKESSKLGVHEAKDEPCLATDSTDLDSKDSPISNVRVTGTKKANITNNAIVLCSEQGSRVNLISANSEGTSTTNEVTNEMPSGTTEQKESQSDRLEVSVVYEQKEEFAGDRSCKVRTVKNYIQFSGSDVVPPSVPSPDTSICEPINPMQSPLYKGYKVSPDFETTAAVANASTDYSNGEEQVTVSHLSQGNVIVISGKGKMDSQDIGKIPTRSQEKSSLNLYSEKGTNEKESSIISNADSIPVDTKLERAAHSLKEGSDLSLVDQGTKEDAMQNNENGVSLRKKEINVLDFDVEMVGIIGENSSKLLSGDQIVNTRSDKNLVKITEDELSERHFQGGKDGEEDLKEGDISTDSTPPLNEDELFSQGTYFDDHVPDAEDHQEVVLPRVGQVSCEMQCQMKVTDQSGKEVDQMGKVAMKSIEMSTEESCTQASVSILEKVTNSAHLVESSRKIVSINNRLKNQDDVAFSIANSCVQTVTESTRTLVSSACQTEHQKSLEMIDIKRLDEERLPTVFSVACQATIVDPNVEKDCMKSVDRQSFRMKSIGCQTEISDGEIASASKGPMVSSSGDVVDGSQVGMCTECKRTICKLPTDIFEIVKRNIQDAVARRELSIIPGRVNYPLNFQASGCIVKQNAKVSNESEKTADEADVGIRIERLSFVPVWMTTETDERTPAGDESASSAELTRAVRASKRNLVKRLIDKSKKAKGIKKTNLKGSAGQEKRVKNEITVGDGVQGSIREEGDQPKDGNVSSSNLDEALAIQKRRNFKKTEQNTADENVAEELDEKCAERGSQEDVIPPTPLSEIMPSIPSVANASSLISAEPNNQVVTSVYKDVSSSMERAIGNLDSILSDDVNLSGQGKDKTDDISAGSEADKGSCQKGSISQSKQDDFPPKKTNVLSLKRKAEKQLARKSVNEDSAKRVKLCSEFVAGHELENDSQADSATNLSLKRVEKRDNTDKASTSICPASLGKADDGSSAIFSGTMADSFTDMNSQLLCDNLSGQVQSREKELDTEAIQETVEAIVVREQADSMKIINEPSFAVLERKEDTLLDDEAILLIETPVCEEEQNHVAGEEVASRREDFDNDDKPAARLSLKKKNIKEKRVKKPQEEEEIALIAEDMQESKADDDTTSCAQMNDKTRPSYNQNNGFCKPNLASPDSYTNYQEDDERDLFASDGEEDDLQGIEDMRSDHDLHDAKVVIDDTQSDIGNTQNAKIDTKHAEDHTHVVEVDLMESATSDNIAEKDIRDAEEGINNAERSRHDDVQGMRDASQDILNAYCLDRGSQNAEDSYNAKSGLEIEDDMPDDEGMDLGVDDKHKERTYYSQESGNGEERSKTNGRNVPNFMALVKEFAKGEENLPREDDSDEEQTLLKPCFERATEKTEEPTASYEAQNSRNQGDKQDTLEHISPLSPTPPPRVKRKRMSPPEAQAALNEIKRLIRSKDDDEDLIAKDENLRVKDADLNNTKKSNERPCTDSWQLTNPPKISHSSPTQRAVPNSQDTPPMKCTNLMYGTPKNSNAEGPARSHIAKSSERGVITTPKIKVEKPLLEKEPQISNMNLNQSKKSRDPQIMVSSRLNKKQMIACKYLASKINCKFSTSYISGTSHLVMGTDENSAIDRSAYTYKYLMALITGSWIVSFRWVHACLESGRAVDENQFEVKGDPSSSQEMVPKLARLSKQRKESPLFHDLTLTLIGDFKASNMTKDQLVELLERGGAQILFELPRIIPSKNYLLIVDPENINSTRKEEFIEANIQPIHYEWITESIINYKIQDPLEFLLKM